MFQAPLDQCYHKASWRLSRLMFALLCIGFISFLPTTSDDHWQLQNQECRYFRMRLSHSSSAFFSILPTKKPKILIGPWLDDMYPHMLIKGKREQCGIIWLVSLGHGPPTKKVNVASTVQCFSTNVTLFSSLRECESKSLHIFDIHNWEEGCLAPSG